MPAMNSRFLLLTVLLHASLVLPARTSAQTTESAGRYTSSAAGMGEALDAILLGRRTEGEKAGALFFLVDPTTTLKESGFAREMAAALERAVATMADRQIAVAAVGAPRAVKVFGPDDHGALVARLDELLASPVDEIKNVYKDLRAAAGLLAETSGERELVLVSLDNGDAEDDLEGTVEQLRKLKVRFSCVASEAYLSDSYWASHRNEIPSSKWEIYGGDGAFIELPWGWLFQMTVANEVAPSGTAVYPLSRLAAATEGRVHLYAPPSGTHQCQVYGTCLFCSGDHMPRNEIYWRSKVTDFGPSTASRDEVMAAAAADPAFRAMLRAWEKAYAKGLLRGSPSVAISGNGLAAQRLRNGKDSGLFSGGGIPKKRRTALQLAVDCEAIRAELEEALAGIDQLSSLPRYRAMATFTLVMLRVTKANLLSYAGWCEEIAPAQAAKSAPELLLPEIDTPNRGRRATGIGFSNFCLCHGVAPFRKVELPGGPAFRAEMDLLAQEVESFETRFAHTPYIAALHRSGIADFTFTYPATYVKPPRPLRGSKTAGDGTTPRVPTGRPSGSSGGTSGGTTGK